MPTRRTHCKNSSRRAKGNSIGVTQVASEFARRGLRKLELVGRLASAQPVRMLCSNPDQIRLFAYFDVFVGRNPWELRSMRHLFCAKEHPILFVLPTALISRISV